MPPNTSKPPQPPPTIELTPAPALRTITPHLMPFHIAHTGPAPLATYFRARPVTPAPPGLKARFVAAFRGRAIQGLAVALPAGFGGVVLRSEDKGKGREAPAKRAKEGRGARSAKRREGDDVVMLDEEADVEETKALKPVAKFASFTLWNADVDVDEERDEYLRFLSEYQRISSEVRKPISLILQSLLTVSARSTASPNSFIATMPTPCILNPSLVQQYPRNLLNSGIGFSLCHCIRTRS